MKTQERECLNQGEMLGMGFDSIRNIYLPSSAIQVDEENDNNICLAQQVPFQEKFRLDHLEAQSDLSRSFSVSAEIGAEIGGIASGLGIPCIFSANAKANFFSGLNIKKENLYILLDYQLYNATCRMPSPKLTVEAQSMLKDQPGQDNFRKKFGDEFIVGFRTGVDYTAIIEISNIQTEEKENTYVKIKTEISNILSEVVALPKDIGAKIENSNQAKLKHYSSKTLCLKRPPNIGNSGICLTLDTLIPDFLNFKEEVSKSANNHIKYSALFAEYDQLVAVQHDILPPDLIRLKLKLNRLRSIKLQKQTLMQSFQNDLRFGGQDSNNGEIFSKFSDLSNDIHELDEFMSECLYLPEAMTKERYRHFLSKDFQYKHLE